MKFPFSMLLDFVQTKLSAEQVGDLLTMAGLEVEGIEDVEGEPVIDVKVMSNRGDALSVYGLSREVLAKDIDAAPTELYRRAGARFSGGPTGSFALSDDVATIESGECNRFACRAFENVPGSVAAPERIRQRLGRAGMRPISLLVDLTNYVMLELGQPLHAFDRDKLRGGRIVVRHAQPGERITTLNGEDHELNGQMMICDGEGPVGVPGVMGGLETEVTPETRRLLLESANFSNRNVRRTRKQLGLNTEASYRFERSVDPDGVVAAIARFTELLGEAVPTATFSNVVDHYPRPPEPRAIPLRVSRASQLLGMSVSESDASGYLERLGFSVAKGGGSLDVGIPTWRPDVVREEDLVEEIGRVHGYENIPERLPSGQTRLGGPQGECFAIDCLREAALRAGFSQVISHTLVDLHPLDDPAHGITDRIGPRVIASPEHAYLRDSLLTSLAAAAQRNGGRNLHLFELGRRFWRTGGSYVEQRALAFLSSGELLPAGRGATSASADFFALKGALEGVWGAVRVSLEFSPHRGDARFHPTRVASLRVAGQPVGILGQIHPDVASALNLPADTYLAEMEIESALAGAAGELAYRRVSRNPAVRRDIAVLLDKAIPYEAVDRAIADSCGEVLERQWLFDVFEGAGIPEGKHSLGIALLLRKAAENFTDEEANQVRDSAVAALAGFGAILR
jgi:phenylalanyl-tRNA synthetase beta chain